MPRFASTRRAAVIPAAALLGVLLDPAAAHAHDAHPAGAHGGPLLAGHVLAVLTWVGCVVVATVRPAASRRLAAAAAVAATSACATGLLLASRAGVDVGSPYARLLMLKGLLVVAVVVTGALALRRPSLVRVEAACLAIIALVAAGLGSAQSTQLPPGVVTTRSATLLVAQDAQGRRLLRVAPASAVVGGIALAPALDGAATGVLPAATRVVAVDGKQVELPEAVPLATGDGDASERLARTLARGLGEHGAQVQDAAVAVRSDVAAARARGLQRVVVLTDGDPRAAAVARAAGLPVVHDPSGSDLVYVATSWGGTSRALAQLRDARPVGGAVLLPWLITGRTLDDARASGLQLLTDRPLDGSAALAYRNALRALPGERPTLLGLAAWSSPGRAAVYAVSPAGVLPVWLDHAHPADAALPPWVAAGRLTVVRTLTPGGAP